MVFKLTVNFLLPYAQLCWEVVRASFQLGSTEASGKGEIDRDREIEREWMHLSKLSVYWILQFGPTRTSKGREFFPRIKENPCFYS